MNDGRFKKGHATWNMGMKGYRPKNQEIGKFRKGHLPKHWVAVGTVTIRKDKNTHTPRRWIKVGDGPVHQFNWKPYACWLWEQVNGPIPKGYIVHHADGDSLNDSPSNYSLVTRSQHAKIHRFSTFRSKQKPKH